MPTDDTDSPDVDAALRYMADHASSPPTWRDAVTRLNPQSTAEERVAVYQAVRDSGWLTEEQSLYLIASCIENLADEEAAAALNDLDRRIDALEERLRAEEGSPEPDEKIAKEYNELSDQYQAASDEIYARNLTDFGETEIAKLYAAENDEFAYCYDVGRNWFEAVADDGQTTSPDDLVSVAPFLNATSAEAARNWLAAAGIPSALGNANVVTWFSYYGNAMGGVILVARRGDAVRAYNLLNGAIGQLPHRRPAWTCPTCGQRIPAEWDACWRCCSQEVITTNVPKKSNPASLVIIAPASPATYLHKILGATLIAIFVLVPLSLGHVSQALYFAPLGLFAAYLLAKLDAPLDPDDLLEGSSADNEARVGSSFAWRTTTRNSTVRRAWQSAVLAFAFPPLALYALWLLSRVAVRESQ